MSDRIEVVGYVYSSKQNGGVYSPNGIAPCLGVGCHSGVEPKLRVIYESC